MINIAAVGDLHCPRGMRIEKAALKKVNNEADFLVLAGDLTSSGILSEAYCLLRELSEVNIPVIGVFGNHEYHHFKQKQIKKLLAENNVHILDGDAIEFQINGQTIGFTGTKGFCGGYGQGLIPDFGEPSLRGLADELDYETDKIKQGIQLLKTDYKVIVMHYCPTVTTLGNELKEIYYFLGSSKLAIPIDKYKADIIFHGHCHHGFKEGQTPGGIPVKNVALPLIKKPYIVYEL